MAHIAVDRSRADVLVGGKLYTRFANETLITLNGKDLHCVW